MADRHPAPLRKRRKKVQAPGATEESEIFEASKESEIEEAPDATEELEIEEATKKATVTTTAWKDSVPRCLIPETVSVKRGADGLVGTPVRPVTSQLSVLSLHSRNSQHSSPRRVTCAISFTASLHR